MFSFSGITSYHQELLLGHTSCVDAVEHYLHQANQKKHLNAYTQLFADEACEKARELDEKRKTGEPLKKLHGVVVAIKDVICYRNHKITAASRILEGFTSLYSATAVQRLLDEDAIIIGACNCDEFAMGSTNENSVYGRVLNALDETKVPGGSSGGSAVAVQAGLCMTSLGSDTGGSVRQPADFCGITGYKPTYGMISRYGLIAYASSFDQIGIFGKRTEDIAIMLETMCGPDEFDSTALPGKPAEFSLERDKGKKYRFAWFKEALDHPSLDKEIRASITGLLHKLEKEGHEVAPVEFGLIDYVVPAYYVLTTAEASSNLGRYDGIRYGHRTKEAVQGLTDFYKRTRSEGFGKEVQRRIMLGTFVLSAGFYDAYYSKAQQVRRLLVDKTAGIFRNFDAIIMPTSPTTAFGFGENNADPVAIYLADIYTVFANLTGIPGVSVPLFKHSNGMPFGLQVMASKEDDITLLQIAKYLAEEHTQQ